MRRLGFLGVLVVLVALSDPDAGSVRVASAAPNAEQRRELSAIRREVAKASGLLRRRRVDDARKTLDAAEGRLKKLIDADARLKRDRTMLGVQRLLDVQKARLLKLPGASKTPVANAPGSPRRKLTIPVGKSSPFELRHAAAKNAERARLEKDLAYWTRVVGGAKPQAAGADRERALFHVGVVNIALQRPKEAQGALRTLVKEFPQGAWTTVARCRLVDLMVEHDLDFKAADAEVTALFKLWWPKDKIYFPSAVKKGQESGKGKGKESGKGRAKPASGGRNPAGNGVPRDRLKPVTTNANKPDVTKVPSIAYPVPTEKRNLAAVYRRHGLVKFVQGGVGYARIALPRARALDPPAGPQTSDDQALQIVMAQALRLRPLTSLTLWTSKKPNYPYIAYADVLCRTTDYERARDFVTRVLSRERLEFTPYQKSYLHYLRGRCYNGIPDVKQRARAAADFLAAQKLDPKAPWADQSLFLAANARWNHEHAGKQAIALWQRLMTEYPKSYEWDRAAYFIGVIHQQQKNYAAAKTAYETLLKDRPKSTFAKLTKEKLKTVDRELARGGRR